MALGMVTTVAGAGLGLAIDEMKANKQQVRQQEMMEMQNQMNLDSSKEMADYNKNIAMDMWNKTNYEAQRKHMEAAGLNPGLMYGMGGGGGATTHSNSGSANVSGQNPYVGENAGMGMQLGLQMAMQEAQIEQLKAQTEKTRVETAQAEVQTQGTKLDNEFKIIQNNIQQATTIPQINQIYNNAQQTAIENDIKARESGIISDTYEAQVDIIRKDAILKSVEIKAKEAQINLTEAQTTETAEKINRIVAEIQRMEAQTEQGKEALLLERMQKEFNTSTPAQIKQWTDIGTDILKATKTVNINSIKK